MKLCNFEIVRFEESGLNNSFGKIEEQMDRSLFYRVANVVIDSSLWHSHYRVFKTEHDAG